MNYPICKTEIWEIDDNGNISFVTFYTLPAKKALIAYKRQQEEYDYNTWNYPEDDSKIKQTPGGEFAYFVGENTCIYTRTIKK